jgi:hypothetical protein
MGEDSLAPRDRTMLQADPADFQPALLRILECVQKTWHEAGRER